MMEPLSHQSISEADLKVERQPVHAVLSRTTTTSQQTEETRRQRSSPAYEAATFSEVPVEARHHSIQRQQTLIHEMRQTVARLRAFRQKRSE
jgi:hypothetical protein